MPWLRHVWRAGARAAMAAETRLGVVVVFLSALGVWWLQAVAMPLTGGRDFATYLGAYAELFQSHPVDLGYVLGRTPGAPLFVGGVLDVAGAAFAEPAVSVLYAATVTAWFLSARAFGGAAGLLTAVVLLLYPSYGILFHELASDAVFAAAFAGWSLLLVRVVRFPTTTGFALVGVGVAMLVLVRPGNQVLLVLALLPFLLGLTWRARLAASAAFVVAAVALLGAWTVHNGVLLGDYTVARGGNSRLPFERVFLTDRIVRPENGPASRKLARAVDSELLPKEPYRSYGIGREDFFSDASPRMLVDLTALANRKWGWENDAQILRDVGVEAIRAHPTVYGRGVVTTVWDLLHLSVFRPLDSSAGTAISGSTRRAPAAGGGVLPLPSEGERIPAPHEGGPTTPDQSIYTVWTSPTEHHLVFVNAGDQERYDALHRRIEELRRNLPDRTGRTTLALRLNQSSRWFPPPVLWLAVGLIGLCFRHPANALALGAPAIAALIVIVLSALAIAAVPHYAVPVTPGFLLLAAGALFAPRRIRP